MSLQQESTEVIEDGPRYNVGKYKKVFDLILEALKIMCFDEN